MTRPVRVLIVEDDIELARAVGRRLGQDGMQVLASPSRVTEAVHELCFEVGVFDIDLLDADGVELASEFLGDGRIERAVFFSASTFQPALGRANELGPVVAKCDGVEALLHAVREVIQPRVPKTSVVVPKAAGRRTRRAG